MIPTTIKGTVLVTGADGFIGRVLCDHATAAGARVIKGVRAKTNGVGETGDAAVLLVDLAGDTAMALPDGIDTIFHLAGRAHATDEFSQDAAEYEKINTRGTLRLLEAALRAKVRSFVFFSSVKAVGSRHAGSGPDLPGQLAFNWHRDGAEPMDETWLSEPETAYGRSKRAAEKLVIDGTFVPHPVVIRPCLVYGPHPTGNLARLIEAVRRKRFPSVPEVGNKRSMVHIEDVASAALLAANDPRAAGRTYIVADDAPFSTRELFEWTCAALGRPVPQRIVPRWALRVLARVGDGVEFLLRRRVGFDSDAFEKLLGDAWYSSRRIQRELGWKPARTLRDSLPEICRSMREG